MKTTITLNKKQGLFRPHATITVELEPWEKNLIPAKVELSFTASVAIAHCDTEPALLSSAGQDEFGHSTSPYVKYDPGESRWVWSEFLPWKPGELAIEDYPELEKLARYIQNRVAKTLMNAIESVEIRHIKELPPPEDYKQKVAACKFATMVREDS